MAPLRLQVHVRHDYAACTSPTPEKVLPLRVLEATRLGQLCDLVALQLASRCQSSTQQGSASPQCGYASQRLPSAKPRDALSLRLIFEGQCLKEGDEEKPLGELGISDGAVVHCVASPKAKKDQRVSCHPHHCSVDGGRSVHIVGEVFPFSTRITCRFGSVPVPAEVKDDGSESGIATLVCTAPPHPAGPVTLTISFDGGATWLDEGPTFLYVDPLFACCPLAVAVPAACGGLDASFSVHGMRWDQGPHDQDQGGGGGCV